MKDGGGVTHRHGRQKKTITNKTSENKANKAVDESNNVVLMGFFSLRGYSTLSHLIILIGGMISIFTVKGYFTEQIFSLEGFNYAVLVSLVEASTMSILALCQAKCTNTHVFPPKIPVFNYLGIALCLMINIGLGNTAMTKINFPTKVLFKSSKLIPVMILGFITTGRTYKAVAYIAALMLTCGLTLFTLGDVQTLPVFDTTGVALIMGAVVADALQSNLQERALVFGGVKQVEMIAYLNGIVSIFFIVVMTSQPSESFFDALTFLQSHPYTAFAIVLESILSYVAIHFYLGIIKKFGVAAAVGSGALRKVFTLLISFTLFPKPFSWMHGVGSTLVFTSLCIRAIM